MGIMTSAVLMTALAQSDTATKTEVIKASLFKNGYAVVFHKATVPPNGEVLIEEPPTATLGTLWITSSKGSKISRIITTKIQKESTTTTNAKSLEEALKLNVGKNAVITILGPDGKESTKSCKIVQANGSLLVIDVNGVTEFHHFGRVISASIQGAVYSKSTQTKKEVPAMRINATPGADILIMAMQPGISWSPAYHIDITDPNKMSIVGKATVINDLTDMSGVDTKLITGFPNMAFLGQWDPLTAFQSVVLNKAMAPAGASMQNQVAFSRRESADFDSVYESFDTGAVSGTQSEDLFFYDLNNVTLKKGDRGYFVLFEASSPYSHIYKLNLGSKVVDARGEITGNSSIYETWHELEFKNQSKLPWTTGPAVARQNDEIIGQDMLKYTSVGANGYLRLSKALDITADVSEEEIDRKREHLQLKYSTYDLLVYKATIKVHNRKNQKVQMRISRVVEGEVTSSSIEMKKTMSTQGLNRVNPMTKLDWNPVLDPGEEMEFTYTAQVYLKVR